MEIRIPTPLDIEKLYELDLRSHENPVYSQMFYRHAIEIFPYTFYIAEENNKIIGFCIGSTVIGNYDKGWILILVVDENCRRKGIGTKLLTKIVKKLSILKCREIFLTVSPKNIDAIRIYKKIGFKTITQDVNFYGKGISRNIMCFRIENS